MIVGQIFGARSINWLLDCRYTGMIIQLVDCRHTGTIIQLVDCKRTGMIIRSVDYRYISAISIIIVGIAALSVC